MTLEDFLKLEQPGITDFLKLDNPETYDFRAEIVVSLAGKSPADRYGIYMAAGIAEEGAKDKNVCRAAKEIYKQQSGIVPRGEADRCDLIKEVYQKLWGELYTQFCDSGDTMNSCSTTINKLLELQFSQGENMDKLKNLEEETLKKLGIADKELFYYPSQSDWAKIKSILLYRYDPKWFNKLLAPAENFLSAAYTIGNFIPWPAGCNGPRGFNNSAIKDYWDLTLWYIYQWYKDNEVWLSFVKVGPKNDSILTLLNSGIVNFSNWLISFGSWDNFVIKNFMQPFVVGGGVKFTYEQEAEEKVAKGFGEPKPLWEGHFDCIGAPKKVHPSDGQIDEFFKNAAAAINARSERMVKALKNPETATGQEKA